MKVNEILKEQQLDELGWGDVKAGATKAVQGVKQAAGTAGQAIKTGAQATGQAAKAGYAAAAPKVASMAKTAGQGIASGYNKLQRGVAGAKAGIAQAKGKQQIDKDTDYWFDRWNSEVVAGNPGAAQSPKVLQQFAGKLASNYVKQGGRLPAVKSMAAPDVKAYLQQVIGLDSSAGAGGFIKQPKGKGAQAGQPAAAQAMAQAAANQPAQTADPTAPAAEPAPVAAANPDGGQDVQQQALAQGVKIVNQEPIIISRGKGREYGLNDNGEWIHLSSGKVQPEALQTFLSQQHDTSLNVPPAQPGVQPQ